MWIYVSETCWHSFQLEKHLLHFLRTEHLVDDIMMNILFGEMLWCEANFASLWCLLMLFLRVIGLQWRLPSQLVVTSDPMVREVVSGALLHQCLNLDYLQSGVAALLNSQMMRSLGVQTLNTQHLLEVGKHIVARLSGPDDICDGTLCTYVFIAHLALGTFRVN